MHAELEKIQQMAKDSAQQVTDPRGQMLCQIAEGVLEALESEYDRYLGRPA